MWPFHWSQRRSVRPKGPPANSDTKERMMKMKGCLDSSKMKVKRCEDTGPPSTHTFCIFWIVLCFCVQGRVGRRRCWLTPCPETVWRDLSSPSYPGLPSLSSSLSPSSTLSPSSPLHSSVSTSSLSSRCLSEWTTWVRSYPHRANQKMKSSSSKSTWKVWRKTLKPSSTTFHMCLQWDLGFPDESVQDNQVKPNHAYLWVFLDENWQILTKEVVQNPIIWKLRFFCLRHVITY